MARGEETAGGKIEGDSGRQWAAVGGSGGFPAMGWWNIGMSCDVHLHGLPSHASGSETGEPFTRDRLEQFYFAKNKTKLKTLKTDSRRSNSQKCNEILLHFDGGIMGLDLFEVGPWLAQQLPKSAANARPGHQGPEADVYL